MVQRVIWRQEVAVDIVLGLSSEITQMMVNLVNMSLR